MTKIRNTAQTFKFVREMRKTQADISKTSLKLASGKRVVTASDDAASLSISTKTLALLRSKQMATRNANDGISLFQIMDGGLSGISDQIVRLRELAISAASDTNSDRERVFIDEERESIVNEIKRFSESIEFNGNKVFSDGELKMELQIDAQSGEHNRLEADMTDMVQTPFALGIYNIRFDSKLHAQLSLDQIDSAINEVTKSRAKVGSMMSAVQSHINKLGVDTVELTNVNSNLIDADYAHETAKLASSKIIQFAQISGLTQANSSKESILKLLK